mmetsp:Transcript_14205/g.26884  ORF Transcript_14205/g.26884 Transcript_14205/m.26884 type:complete len:209 (-) Transcript_14205:1304-1930(-)
MLQPQRFHRSQKTKAGPIYLPQSFQSETTKADPSCPTFQPARSCLPRGFQSNKTKTTADPMFLTCLSRRIWPTTKENQTGRPTPGRIIPPTTPGLHLLPRTPTIREHRRTMKEDRTRKRSFRLPSSFSCTIPSSPSPSQPAGRRTRTGSSIRSTSTRPSLTILSTARPVGSSSIRSREAESTGRSRTPCRTSSPCRPGRRRRMMIRTT